MKTIRLIFVVILSLMTYSSFAQTPGQPEDPMVTEMRQKLGIDYSMPDFDTKKIDGKVIGLRLAKMLEFLQNNYNQGTYNRQLSNIRFEATEDPRIRFLGVDKLKILRVYKLGNDIIVRLQTCS